MKNQRTHLVDLLRIYGYLIIPCFFIFGLDLLLSIFTDELVILYPIFRKVEYLPLYLIFTWFASVVWLAVVLVLICTRRYRYVLKDFIINLFFWTALACLFIFILWLILTKAGVLS